MPTSNNSADERCARCVHFERDPRAIEAAVPGLSTMSSGFASVRGDDGLCLHHQRFVPADASCASFAEKSATP